MPGGFGTLDEFFETLTLVQTKMITNFPIVIYGKQYHKELMEYMEYLVIQGTIQREDLSLVLVTESIDEAMEHISTYITTNYKIKPRKRFWWLFEKR